jgi:hypothetical protein
MERRWEGEARVTGHMPDEGMGHCIREVHEVPLWAMLIGCLSLPCLLLGPSFQYAKFWNTQCAEGVSALTLAIGSLARGLICVNLVILHYDQLYVCYVNDAEHPQNWVHCQARCSPASWCPTRWCPTRLPSARVGENC